MLTPTRTKQRRVHGRLLPVPQYIQYFTALMPICLRLILVVALPSITTTTTILLLVQDPPHPVLILS
ncbi:hypothetical protein INS49_006097 [Diaporthe citri]|uniref:uncharacterized protein n=1 Tax=Diaporthe citri TaxID=83186 RepID=UPI001C7E7652|nr:uncharacterized protein INS49_006097 [Diaporthe citri]KAG6364496.1 hypothetical protein INS49_006097 [Diaporthe citri]